MWEFFFSFLFFKERLVKTAGHIFITPGDGEEGACFIVGQEVTAENKAKDAAHL